MFTPDTLSMFLKEQAWPVGTVVFLVVAVLIVLKISATSRRARLARERSHVTEQSFGNEMARYGFDALIARTTYRYLQQVQNIQFPILASDTLDEDLGLGNEDVAQSVHELLEALGREEARGVSDKPMMTVEDLVRQLQASPRMAMAA